MPPSTIIAAGHLFDGRIARPHPVTLRLAERLEIEGAGIREDWNLLDVRAGETAPPTMRIGLSGNPVRIEFTDAALASALSSRCPDLRRDEAGGGGLLRFVAWSLAAGVSVLLLAIYGVPAAAGLLAPMVPAPVEARFGEAVDGQIVSILGAPPLCDDPAGTAVLDRLVARLTRGMDLPDAPVVRVRRHAVANALTLPGGRVIVLSDIIEKARTPDEFAAILGHEFGHVAARDPTRSVITAGGVSFLLSLILGDLTGSTVIVTVAQAVISAGYSREAENAADAYAVAMMRRAGGDAGALAAILERIDTDSDRESVTGFLRSHPHTRERAAAIRALAGTDTADRRILSDEEWKTLRGICPASAGKPKKDRTPEPAPGTPL